VATVDVWRADFEFEYELVGEERGENKGRENGDSMTVLLSIPLSRG
jgi:hypothetical protein